MNTKLLCEIVSKTDKDSALALVPAEILEKFAELIVRECICLVLNGKYDEEKYNPNNDFDRGHNRALDNAAEGFKQHFGVKE